MMCLKALGSGKERSHFYEFVGEVITNVPDGRADRGFFIFEESPSLQENNESIENGLMQLKDFAPFTKNDYLFIDRSREIGFVDSNRLRLFSNFCNETGFIMRNILYVSQNVKMPQLIEGTCRKMNLTEGPRHLAFHHYFVSMIKAYREIKVGDFDYSNLRGKPPRILCMNNKIRPHRQALLAYILSNHLESEFFISAKNQAKLFDLRKVESEIREQFPSFVEYAEPWFSRGWPSFFLGKNFASVSGVESFPEVGARDSFFALVTESDYKSNILRITEKTLKPTVFCRPFAVLGPPNCLRFFRSFGFQTFSGPLDESYDERQDPDDRLLSLIEAVNQVRLACRNPEGLSKFLGEVRDVCLSNQRHFFSGFEVTLRKHLATELHTILSGA